MNDRAQMSFEFTIGLLMVMLMSLFFIFCVDEYMGIDQSFKNVDILMDDFQTKSELVRHSGYDMVSYYTFPDEIDGENYSFSLVSETLLGRSVLIVNKTGEEYYGYMPLMINLTPIGGKGEYKIIKNQSGMFIAWQADVDDVIGIIVNCDAFNAQIRPICEEINLHHDENLEDVCDVGSFGAPQEKACLALIYDNVSICNEITPGPFRSGCLDALASVQWS